MVEQLGVLAREGLIDIWDDTRLRAGEAWLSILDEEMRNARIAVLLISASFLTSDFIRDEEVPRLYDRHEADGLTMYPLLVRSCPWQEVPWLARMQIHPRGAKPLASYRSAKVDEVVADVALEIASIARSP